VLSVLSGASEVQHHHIVDDVKTEIRSDPIEQAKAAPPRDDIADV
jgi:hypothetical protein